MVKQRVILGVTVCVSVAMFTGQTFSWARASNRKPVPPFPPFKSLRDLTDEEKAKAIEKWRDDREQQQKRIHREHVNRMSTEAWKQLLRVNEQQWGIIEQKINKVYVISWPLQVRAYGSHDRDGNFHWDRPSRDGGPMSGKPRNQMPEVYRTIEELIDLLEDKNSKDEQIRQKIDALQQVRENACKELAQVGRELAPLLTTPRQEAIFLIMGWID